MAHVQKGLSTAFLHAIGLLFSGDMPSGTAAKPRSAEEAFFLKFFGDPQLALVDVDRRIVEKEGLAGFIRLAWHTVEQEGTYKNNWHVSAIAEHLEAVSLGQIKRLMMMVPPRHMKSLSTAVMWPAWDWIENPWRRFLFASYAHNLSIRDSVRCRAVLSSPWYKARWGDRFHLTGDQNTKIRFTNNQSGQRLSTSVGGQLTGEGGDIVACLPASATVQTERGIRTIQDVAAGTDAVVMAFDHAAGTPAMFPIARRMKNPPQALVEIETAHGNVMRCTEDHPVWVVGKGYVAAGSIEEGDEVLICLDASTRSVMNAVRSRVKRVARLPPEGPVYNLEVAGAHNFFVDGVLTHNCDDANNALKADSETTRENTIKWWDEAMSTRLSNPQKGAFVLIQQRLNAMDLIGHVISKHGLIHQGGDYYCLCLPARYEPDHPQRWFRDPRTELGQLLWPSHIDEDTMRSLELALGPYAAAGQLQQRPTAREGGYFKRHWFSKVKTIAPDTEWVRGWDFAASEVKLTKSDPDYTASILVGFSPSRGKWIIAHAERFREGPGEVRRRMKARAEADRVAYGYHRIAFPQDPGQAGKDQAQSFGLLLASFSFECRPVTGKKVERATPFAGQAELGMVEILDTSDQEGEADWNKALLDELTSFPAGAHDDFVDALTIAFNHQSGGTTGLIDYYARLLREKREKAAAAAAAPQPPGYRVVTGTTTNMAEATTTAAQRKP